MSDSLSSRTRLLCLLEIFNMYSNEINALSVEEICEKLAEYGYSVSKRTVLADIKVINSTQFKIIKVNHPKKGYYLATSNPQEALSIIIESVLSSDLLNAERMDYIKKFFYNKACLPTVDLVMDTSETYYSALPKKEISQIALINARLAIKDKKQLSITYSRIIPGDSFSLAEKEETLIVNPIKIAIYGGMLSLVFSDVNTPEKIEFINMPRIKSANIMASDSIKSDGSLLTAINHFNSKPSNASLVRTEWIMLKFKTEEIEAVENYFNAPIEFRKSEDDGYCIAKIFATLDQSLFGYLLIMGDRIEIIKPDSLRQLFMDKVTNYYNSQKR